MFKTIITLIIFVFMGYGLASWQIHRSQAKKLEDCYKQEESGAILAGRKIFKLRSLKGRLKKYKSERVEKINLLCRDILKSKGLPAPKRRRSRVERTVPVNVKPATPVANEQVVGSANVQFDAERLEKAGTVNSIRFARFSASKMLPDGYKEFGYIREKVSNISLALREKITTSPLFFNLPRSIMKDILFFNKNFNSTFSGHSITGRGVMSIQISEAENNIATKIALLDVPVPDYGIQKIHEDGMWRFNGTSRGIVQLNNVCAVDPRYDMQYKEFFYYFSKNIIGCNIYCKKSSEAVWKHISSYTLTGRL